MCVFDNTPSLQKKLIFQFFFIRRGEDTSYSKEKLVAVLVCLLKLIFPATLLFLLLPL